MTQAYQNKTAINSNAVHSSPQGCGGREEVGGDAGAENDTQPHGKGSAHVEELVAGSAHGHSGESAHHACSVPGSPGQDRATEQAEWGNEGADNSAVGEPGGLLGADSGGVRDAARDHAGPDHGGNAHAHGNKSTPVEQQVDGSRRSVDGSSCASSGDQARPKVEVSVPHLRVDFMLLQEISTKTASLPCP